MKQLDDINKNLIQKVQTSGEMRQFIIEVMMGVRDGRITACDAQAMISGMKEINSSMQVEINAAKIWMQASKEGYSLGKSMKKIGKSTIIGNDDDD